MEPCVVRAAWLERAGVVGLRVRLPGYLLPRTRYLSVSNVEGAVSWNGEAVRSAGDLVARVKASKSWPVVILHAETSRLPGCEGAAINAEFSQKG